MTPAFETYLADRGRFAVERALVQRVLADVQPLALEALGLHAGRQVLWDGWLPVNPVMTTPETNGGWGELMPAWFKPYERPVPLYCLDNWALFAGLYREAFGPAAGGEHFDVENLVRSIVSGDLLLPFLPTTQGMGRFLRHGVLPTLLGICWLPGPAREAWLSFHAAGARALAADMPVLSTEPELEAWLIRVETDGLLVPERAAVAGEAAVAAFLADGDRYPAYLRLLQALCLSVTALAEHYGPDWRSWCFQAVNAHYRLPGFGLPEIQAWLQRRRAAPR